MKLTTPVSPAERVLSMRGYLAELASARPKVIASGPRDGFMEQAKLAHGAGSASKVSNTCSKAVPL
jgi:hypothetical protein